MKKMTFLFCLSMGILSLVNAQTPAADTTLQEYVGKYVFPDGSPVADVMVSLENGILSSTSSAGVATLEKQQGEDLFAIPQYQGTAKFNRDANKKIIGVSINAMGYQLEGTKTGSIAFADKFKKTATTNTMFVVERVR